MTGWLRKIGLRLALALAPVRPQPVDAQFDSAQTTEENRNHWKLADGLDADSANSPFVRRIIRNRARYEFHNNSILNGMVKTLANDVVGYGPSLLLNGGDSNLNSFVQREVYKWMRAIDLTAKLRQMRMSRSVDGEAFAIIFWNSSLPNRVKWDIRLVEADQFATPEFTGLDPNEIDGIRFDENGNPIEYYLLKHHPGDVRGMVEALTYERIPARFVIHRFATLRAGQHRGISEIMPSLPLCAQGRRYSLAVLGAAETAADFAAVVQSDVPPSEEGDDSAAKPFVTLELEKRMMTVLPKGWKLGQLESQQPTTTYSEYKRELVNEQARCVLMPFNIAYGNSSSYNYASGRLDHQTYFLSIEIDRDEDEVKTLDRLFGLWVETAIAESWPMANSSASNYLPGTKNDHLNLVSENEWMWRGREHVDPEKEANAQEVRLRNHTTTLADEYARQGFDWRVKLRQRAEELAMMRELDIPLSSGAPTPTNAKPQKQEEEAGGEEKSQKRAA